MKKLKRISKWTFLSLICLIVVLSITVAMRQDLRYDAPYPDIHASKDSAVIAHGRHIVFSQAHCADCHSTQNADSLLDLGIEPSLSGGRLFDVGIARIYTPNITSDPQYGVGRYTDQEIARAIRYGVHPDGSAMLNFMNFSEMTDGDLTAVVSYLRTQKPVPQKRKKSTYTLLGAVVKAFMVKPVGPKKKLQKVMPAAATAAYGEYLVNSTTNCSGCHTQRDLAGNFTGSLMAGGNQIGELVSVNLTPDSTSRIFGWTEQMFLNRMRLGKLNPKSEMPWNSFKRMTDVELKAIYRYLRTVPAAKMPEVKA